MSSQRNLFQVSTGTAKAISPEAAGKRIAPAGAENAGATKGAAAPSEPGHVAAPDVAVWIWRMTAGISTYGWLCGPCATELAAHGWTLDRIGECSFQCDRCDGGFI